MFAINVLVFDVDETIAFGGDVDCNILTVLLLFMFVVMLVAAAVTALTALTAVTVVPNVLIVAADVTESFV